MSDFELGSKEHAEEILKAVDGRQDLVHAAYQYECQRCRSGSWIFLGVGVEGPGVLRETNLYIPSPFMGPRCSSCGGDTMHVRWREDRHFPPVDPQPGARYFRVPKSWTPETLANLGSVVFAGEIVEAP